MNEDDTFDALRRPLTQDEIEFGRGKWIYCGQHLRYHMTGWCTVSNQDKIALKATCVEEANIECAARGLKIYRGN